MSYIIKIGTNDISDYVTSIGEVPIMSRNLDYTFNAEGYDFVLSYSSTTVPVVDAKVYFYSGSVLLHNGYISDVSKDDGKFTYNVTVEHALLKLREKYAEKDGTYPTFWDVMGTYGSDLNIRSTQFPTPMVNHISLLAGIMYMIGMTLSSTYYQARNVTWTAVRGVVDGDTGTTNGYPGVYIQEPITIPESKLYLMEEQIYCAGQEKILSVESIEQGPAVGNGWTDYKPNRITLWDLFVAVASATQLVFYPKDETSFYIINKKGFNIATFDANIKYGLREEAFSPKADSVKLSYKTLNHRPSHWWRETQSPHNGEYYWFPQLDPPVWLPRFYDVNGWEQRSTDDPLYDAFKHLSTYNTGAGTGTNSATIKWPNHLDFVYLSQTYMPDPYIIWLSAQGNYSPFTPIVQALTTGGKKYELITDANYMLSDQSRYMNRDFMSIVVDDIEKDTVKIEYLEFLV